jgi:hypothetical protein
MQRHEEELKVKSFMAGETEMKVAQQLMKELDKNFSEVIRYCIRMTADIHEIKMDDLKREAIE